METKVVTENQTLTLARLPWKYICSDNTDVRGDPQDPSLSPRASRREDGVQVILG